VSGCLVVDTKELNEVRDGVNARERVDRYLAALEVKRPRSNAIDVDFLSAALGWYLLPTSRVVVKNDTTPFCQDRRQNYKAEAARNPGERASAGHNETSFGLDWGMANGDKPAGAVQGLPPGPSTQGF
jgi:hypothetical protein